MRLNLPVAREPRRYVQPLLLVLRVLLHLPPKWRARADNAHVALEDVNQLRKLVDARLANEPANAGNSWIEGSHFYFEDYHEIFDLEKTRPQYMAF